VGVECAEKRRRRRRRKMSVAVNSSVVVGVGAGTTQNQNHNVFVYGSLLADEVVGALLNRVPPSSPATLSD